MKSTSRLRVLSDRIPRVLVFVYFCRGLSGTEERPTRRDYIEILTCRAIILHLEETPEATGRKRRPNGAKGRAPALLPWAPALTWSPIRTLSLWTSPPT